VQVLSVNTSARQAGSLIMVERSRVEDRSLLLFFLIAFAWSWILWLPEILWGISLGVAAFGPTVAAFLLTYLNQRQGGVIKLLSRAVDYHFAKIWLIPIFLLMPLIAGGALLFSTVAEEVTPSMPVLSNPWLVLVGFVYILFLGGPVEEEFGWRGYALDRLQARYSALASSVILGVVWSMWHLPLFFFSQTIYYQKPVWGLIVTVTLQAVLFTWIYNNTGSSLLAALLFHTMSNLSHFMFPALETDLGSLFTLIFTATAVGVVLVIWGPKKMVRRKT